MCRDSGEVVGVVMEHEPPPWAELQALNPRAPRLVDVIESSRKYQEKRKKQAARALAHGRSRGRRRSLWGLNLSPFLL